ncbi:unnamed protein product [marine sediment metagenome]|uniref:Uncharacterized protein n=1 Tax=marine sediment metagenome TaxID=412755 RepID=X1LQP3_9ZZZZ
MDNFDSSNITPSEDRNAPIPFDDDDKSGASVSHSPLSLGGGGTAEAPKVEAAPHLAKPDAKKPAEKVVSTERITGVKTFFTRLHAGAIDYLDEQISNWLKQNPGITIKRTNTVTGEIQGKKTEPNIIVTVWY